jgi:hypothetical protein
MPLQLESNTTPTSPCSSSSPSSPSANTRSKSRVSGDHYAFAPPISKRALPRAWERKPATPFAPRTDTHKIWKRCEKLLGMWGYKREGAPSENGRSVKRLRVDDGVNKGAGFLGTRYEDLGEGGRRKAWCAVELDEGICLVADEEMSAEDVFAALDKATFSSLMLDTARDDIAAGDSRAAGAEAAEEETSSFQTAHDDLAFVRPFRPRSAQIMSDSKRIDAMIDKLASPISFKRIGRKRNSRVTEDKIADVEQRGRIQKDQRPQNATDTPDDLETQTTNDSCKTPASPSKDLSMTETDDREYLHAFITRAKARKAARAMVGSESSSTETSRPVASSPRTRSRTALAMLDRKSSPPSVTGEVGLLGPTVEQNSVMLPGLGETSPLRKSSRTRLQRPQRNQPAVPCTIHFRRSNGTEFIFLQKTDAQQIALATRSNTRRNRGEGLGPKMKLEALSVQAPPSPTKIERKRKNSKQVSWDEGLAYFAPEEVQPTTETAEGPTEQKTPLKRSRRLAQGRGTPAPRRKMAETAIAMDAAEDPTPRKRTRTSTKGKT